MNNQSAFSLIELLVALCIVGILVAIAYPMYGNYLSKTHQVQAEQNLLLLSQNFEVYYGENHSYLNASLAILGNPSILNNEYYDYQIQALTQDSYLLAAIPKKSDTECGTLTIDQLGKKNSSGIAPNNECWN